MAKKTISETARERRDKIQGKGQDAKSIENRVHYEASEEGFTRGGGKKKQKPMKPGGGY